MATAVTTGKAWRPRPPKLRVVPFENESGTTSFRVVGFAGGERIRRNFPTRTEAELEKARLLAKHCGVVAPHTVMTTLTEAQVRGAEAFYLELPSGVDPVTVVRFYRDHFRPVVVLPITGAIQAFGEWLGDQRKNEELTIDQRKTVLTHFANHRGIVDGKPVGPVKRTDEITIATAQAWIYSADVGPRTQRDRFDVLLLFCRFLTKKHHATDNPVTELDRPVVKIDAPGVLNFEQTWTLLMCALTDAEGPEMLPFFAIGVLSGVRPQEVPRLAGWNDIHLDEDLRIIEVNKAKGGRSRRNAEICEPLWRILVWCKERGLAPNYYSTRKFNRIRRNAGLFDLWEKDLLRHTYASHHYALHKDVKTLISSMGNSERVLFQNYIRPRPRSEAILFLGLILHWSAPQRASQAGRRIDRLFARPPAQLSLDDLRLLRTRVAGELAKVKRRHDGPAERDMLAAKLESLVNELRARSTTTESTTSHEPNNSLDHDARLSA